MKRRYFWIPVVLICLALGGCAGKKESVPDTVQRVLNAMLECPNEELYTSSGEVIPLEQAAPAQVNGEGTEQEKEVWKKAVGDCFAGEMFETFFRSDERVWVLSRAAAEDQTVSVSSTAAGEQKNGVQDIQVTILVKSPDGSEKEYELKWQVVYDSQEKEKLQTIRLIADSGYVS